MSTPLQEAVAEVVAAVAPPLTIAVAVLSIIFLGFSWTNLVQLLVGALFTTAGLFLFLRGTRIALLPMGEMIGAYLPQTRFHGPLVATSFIFTFSVTIADLQCTYWYHRLHPSLTRASTPVCWLC